MQRRRTSIPSRSRRGSRKPKAIEPSSSTEVVRVAQFDEVLAGVRMLDAGIREVLGAQGDLVVAGRPERAAHAEMVAEVECRAEVLVGAAIDARSHRHSHPALDEPG